MVDKLMSYRNAWLRKANIAWLVFYFRLYDFFLILGFPIYV
jgi:hypothetical protein